MITLPTCQLKHANVLLLKIWLLCRLANWHILLCYFSCINETKCQVKKRDRISFWISKWDLFFDPMTWTLYDRSTPINRDMIYVIFIVMKMIRIMGRAIELVGCKVLSPKIFSTIGGLNNRDILAVWENQTRALMLSRIVPLLDHAWLYSTRIKW